MLKNKRAVRRLALLVCLSLIVGVLPAGMWSVPVQVNAVEAVNEFVINGGFDDGLTSWRGVHKSADDKIEVVDGAAQFSATVKAIYLEQTANVADAAGKTFKLTLDFTRISGSGEPYVMLKFRNAVPSTLHYEVVNLTETGTYEIEAVAPAGTAILHVEVGNNSNTKASYTIDNISLTAEGAAIPENTQPTAPTQSTAPSQSTEPSAAPEGNLLTNGDFEDGVAGWPASSVLSSCTEDKHSGNAALKFVDNNGNAGGPYFQQVVAVEAGKTYKLSAWVKVLEGTNGYFGVYGIGNANKQQPFGEAGDWKQVEMTVTVPADKTEAKIEIGANSGSAVTYLLDDMVFAVVGSEPEETVPTEVPNPTESTGAPDSAYLFEDFTDGSAVPDVSAEAWKEFNGDAETVLTKESNFYKVGRGGSNKLVFQAGVKNVQYYAKSPVFPIEGGKGYTARYQAAWYFNNTDIDTVELVFVDAAGKILATQTADAFDPAAEQGAWADMAVAAVAPADATGAYLKFNYMVVGKVHDCWIRNLKVAEGVQEEDPTEPTEPTESTEPKDPNLMLEDHFEQLADSKDANSGPLGWISDDDAGGIYSVAISCANKANFRYDGYYLLLQMTGSWTVQSAEFAVKPGYEYTADFMARKLVDNKDFNGYLSICFVDVFGILLQVEKETVGKTYGEWTAETVKAVAPAGAAKAYLIFGLDNTGRKVKADYAVDDLVVTQSTEPVIELGQMTEVATEPVYQDNFNDYYTPEGAASSIRLPTGWTASQQSAAISCTKYDDYDGSTNLCLQNTDDKWIRTPLLDAKAGNTYTAVFVEKKLNPAVEATGGYVKIVFVDADGNIVDQAVKNIGVASRWSRNGLSALAPEGAAGVYVEFGIANHTGGGPAFCVDNLEIIKSAGKLPAPGGNTPEGGTTPPTEDDNSQTGDNTALLTMSAVMIATAALAVLVISKRRFF